MIDENNNIIKYVPTTYSIVEIKDRKEEPELKPYTYHTEHYDPETQSNIWKEHTREKTAEEKMDELLKMNITENLNKIADKLEKTDQAVEELALMSATGGDMGGLGEEDQSPSEPDGTSSGSEPSPKAPEDTQGTPSGPSDTSQEGPTEPSEGKPSAGPENSTSDTV